MHPALLAIRDATIGTPFQNELWIVGGAVRDELMGIELANDFDIVLRGDALAAAEFLHQMNLATIEPVTYPRFGTALVRVLGTNIEFVGARRESYEDNSRKPNVEPASLEEDALRRDFTINSLMRNLHTEELYDPLRTGLSDLKNKILRTPLDPDQTFYDDPLRMLRAIRFRWQLQFTPAEGVYESITQNCARLKVISAERIRDELTKMLTRLSAADALSDLMNTGLLAEFAPDLVHLQGLEQGDYHHLDAWEHTLLAINNAQSKDLILNLALLLHDVAKPVCKTIDENGRIRFLGHEKVGADMAATWLRDMKFPTDQIDKVCRLVRHHMRIGSAPKISDTAARRILRDLGEQTDQLLDLVEADSGAHHPDAQLALNMTEVRDKIANVRTVTPAHTLKSPLTGDEVMAVLEMTPGPAVGEAQSWLVEQVLKGMLQPGDKIEATRLLTETYRAKSP